MSVSSTVSSTLRQEGQESPPPPPSSLLTKLCFWIKPKPEGPRRTVVANHTVPSGTKSKHHPNGRFCNNRVRTTKYTLLTFIPKNLFEQLHRFANVYFLSIILLNWVIQAFGKEIAMFPVLFVLGVTAVKDLFEDRRRYNSDKRINNATCRVWNRAEERYVNLTWKELRVGDIVRLESNESIPADILLLHTSDPNGICYIETMNLDGESNLKQRAVVRDLMNPEENFNPSQFHCTLDVERPTQKIYQFSGKLIHSEDGEQVALTTENLLLRSCFLKNTEFVEGIVVYAGPDTKAMLNNGGPRHKRTRLEKLMNVEVLGCVVVLAALCVIGATGSTIWYFKYEDKSPQFLPPDELDEDEPHVVLRVIVSFLTYVILLQVLIPLSLYVTIELTKLAQIYHIHNDKDLYDPETGKKVQCRATNITEDLGQIQYIFSDKTGTLTENKMIFRRCCVNGEDYDHEASTPQEEQMYKKRGYSSPPPLKVNQSMCEHLERATNSHNSEDALSEEQRNDIQRVHDFFMILATCNTVVVAKPHQQSNNRGGGNINHGFVEIQEVCEEEEEVQQPNFEAESPDELALVQAAYSYNCKLVRKTPQALYLSMPGGDSLQYEILQVFPFDSTRKRMSVILRNPRTNQIVMYCKGADSAMFSRLKANQTNAHLAIRTQRVINNYAREGLRVLVMAKRILSEEEYSSWYAGFHAAELDESEDRDSLMYTCWCSLEVNIDLVGATGVEDRLQDRVPETIEALREAGIVVWVLTGDKQETAINISYSCRLFSPDMDIIKLNIPNKEAVDKAISYYLDRIEKHNKFCKMGFGGGATNMNQPDGSSDETIENSEEAFLELTGNERALVVDGKTLTFILDPKAALISKFLRLTKHCSSVLCCRATPLQKAFIVSSVKAQLGMITLAIGDGANDVSMIQRADVGIGISGKEGMQAVMASDFAIAKFKYIEKLLLVHGHWCYDRLARMILYFFYKNAAFVFVIFWYQLLNGWSGSVMIDQIYLQVFNLIFTALPPMAIGIYDQDASAEVLLANPKLYTQGRLQKIHKPHAFWLNMADALYQSIVIFFVAYGAYNGTDVGMFEFGTTITVSCMYAMLTHMAVEAKSWTILHVLSILISVLGFYSFAFLYNTVCINCLGFENPFWVIHEIIGSPVHWLIVVVSTMLAVIPRMTLRCLVTAINPSEVTTALLDEKNEESSSSSEAGSSWSGSFSSSSVKSKMRMFCCRKKGLWGPSSSRSSSIEDKNCSNVSNPVVHCHRRGDSSGMSS